MQLAWFIAHTSLGLQTTLIQVREAKLTPQKKPEKLILQVDPSPVPISAALKEINLHEKQEDVFITASTRVIFERAEKVSIARNASVLITGETGTGKEIIARYIHQHSARRSYPFVALNCSAFSDNLLESRLFGYRKGAFTDAKKDTKGLFQSAEGGTLFLDEIGDISSYMQQSLLRVLQEKEVHPIGGKPLSVDVRIIAATNRDLISLECITKLGQGKNKSERKC